MEPDNLIQSDQRERVVVIAAFGIVMVVSIIVGAIFDAILGTGPRLTWMLPVGNGYAISLGRPRIDIKTRPLAAMIHILAFYVVIDFLSSLMLGR